MKSAVMNEEAVLEIKRLYELRDQFNRRVWSHARLGKAFGVGETTIYRVLNGYGTFENAPTPLADNEETRARAAASAAKLLEMLKNEPEKGDQNVAAKPAAPVDPVAAAAAAKYGFGPKLSE